MAGKVFGLYHSRMPDENILVKTTKCIWVSSKSAVCIVGLWPEKIYYSGVAF